MGMVPPHGETDEISHRSMDKVIITAFLKCKSFQSMILPSHPAKSPMSTRCLPAETPVAQGLAGFLPFCTVHPEGYPFRMSKGRETPAARALCGFFLPRMLGIWYPHAGGASVCFRRCEQMRSSSSPLEAARETAEGPPARRRSRPKERKFQKGE